MALDVPLLVDNVSVNVVKLQKQLTPRTQIIHILFQIQKKLLIAKLNINHCIMNIFHHTTMDLLVLQFGNCNNKTYSLVVLVSFDPN